LAPSSEYDGSIFAAAAMLSVETPNFLFLNFFCYRFGVNCFAVSVSFCVMYLPQASPFLVEVYAEKCTPSLKVSTIDLGGKILMNAVVDMVIRKVVHRTCLNV